MTRKPLTLTEAFLQESLAENKRLRSEVRRFKSHNRRMRKALLTPEQDNGRIRCRYCKHSAHMGDSILHEFSCVAEAAIAPSKRGSK